jgi:hypothetical protein
MVSIPYYLISIPENLVFIPGYLVAIPEYMVSIPEYLSQCHYNSQIERLQDKKKTINEQYK